MTAGGLKITLYPKMWRRERSLGPADLKCSCGLGPQAKPYFREKMRTIVLTRSQSVRRTHALMSKHRWVGPVETGAWEQGNRLLESGVSVYSIWESLTSR